jgi:adenylylsulfate kinase
MDAKLTWHEHPINQSIRSDMKNQKPFVLWFTGLSCSGKSTLAGEVERLLTQQNKHTYLLDGDNVRRGLCSDLGFNDEDRAENIRRISEVSKLMLDAGMIVLAAFISPKQSHRMLAREVAKDNTFIEIFVDASLEVCEKRDIKGLYKEARSGKLSGFTGIGAEYEAPSNPDIHIRTEGGSVKEHALQVMNYLYKYGDLER